jgi:hypothetical protein
MRGDHFIDPIFISKTIATPKPGFQLSQDIYHGVEVHLDHLPWRNRCLTTLIHQFNPFYEHTQKDMCDPQ